MADDATLNLTVAAKDKASATLKGINRELGASAKTSEDTSKQLRNAGLAIAAVGAGITLYAKSATEYTVQYVKQSTALSRTIGENVTETSRLQYALQQSGVAADRTSAIFGTFSRNIVKARDDSKYAETALANLNVKVKEADGSSRSFSTILLDVADRFAAMPDGATKTAAAIDLFGRSGRDLIPFLNKGSEGIRKLQEDADKLGLTLTTENVAAVRKYIQSQKELEASSNSLKVAVGTLTAPVLANVNTKLNETFQTLVSGNPTVKNLTANFLAFGGPILAASGSLIGFVANMRTAANGMKLAALASRLLQAAIGPVGWIMLGVGAIVAGATYLLHRHSEATTESTETTEKLASAEQLINQQLELEQENLDRLTQAQNALKDARFAAEGSALSVERSQRSYNEAVKEYGPASLEAREAAHNLEEAKRRLEEANVKVAAAQDQQNTAEGHMVERTPDVLGAIQLRIDKVRGLTYAFHETITKVADLDGRMLTVSGTIQGNIANIQGSLNDTNRLINNLNTQKASTSVLQGSGRSLQGRASGGRVEPGGAYLVGENPDGTPNRTSEIFIPDRPGTVLNSGDSQDALGAGQVINNILSGTFIFNNAEASNAFFDRIDKTQRLARMGMA